MNKYPFEEGTYSRIQESSDLLRKTLAERLLVKDQAGNYHAFGGDEKYKIEAFLSTFNGNIKWYTKEIKTEKRLIRGYNLASVLLIVIIPIAIFYFTDRFPFAGAPSVDRRPPYEWYESMSGIIVAFLTSIIGLQKVATEWMDRRKFLSNYHKASSDLKSKFYEFEYTWNNKEVYDFAKAEITPKFDTALEQVITEGRQIASDERMAYYEAIENPSIDVGNVITSSFNSAFSIFKNMQSQKFERKMGEQLKQEELKKDILSLKKEKETLAKLEESTQDKITAAGSPVPIQLTTFLNSIHARLAEIELELNKKEAEWSR